MNKSTLPFDIERCPGNTSELCKTCRRKEPGCPHWQSYGPATAADGKCHKYIAPEPKGRNEHQAYRTRAIGTDVV